MLLYGHAYGGIEPANVYGVMSEIESNTNQLLRKKYFVDANSVILRQKNTDIKRDLSTSAIIDSSKVKVSKKPVRIRTHSEGATESIVVDVIRDGDRITGLRVSCPCGRCTEMNCEYAPAES